MANLGVGITGLVLPARDRYQAPSAENLNRQAKETTEMSAISMTAPQIQDAHYLEIGICRARVSRLNVRADADCICEG